MEYILLDADNKLVKAGFVSDERDLANNCDTEAGERIFAVPSGTVSWNQMNPAPLKEALWSTVKQCRTALIERGIDVPGIGKFDSHTGARFNLALVSQTAASTKDKNWSVEWDMADNSTMTLNAKQVKEAHDYLVRYADTVQAHARDLRKQIEATDDVATLLLLDVVNGWPAQAH